MRRRAGVLVIATAALLGTLTGAFALPDRQGEPLTGSGNGPTTRTGSVASPRSSPATPSQPETSPSTPRPSTGDGPVDATDLLTGDDLAAVGLDLRPQRSDGRAEIVVCTDHETLDDVAESGPPAQQFWDGGTVGLTEQVITARDEEEAVADVRRVLRRLEACQHRPAGSWLYGPTHAVRLPGPGTASWLGEVSGEQNTTGRAAAGTPVIGAVAVLRRGSRVAVLNLAWCQSAGDEAACAGAPEGAEVRFVELIRRAAERLG